MLVVSDHSDIAGAIQDFFRVYFASTYSLSITCCALYQKNILYRVVSFSCSKNVIFLTDSFNSEIQVDFYRLTRSTKYRRIRLLCRMNTHTMYHNWYSVISVTGIHEKSDSSNFTIFIFWLFQYYLGIKICLIRMESFFRQNMNESRHLQAFLFRHYQVVEKIFFQLLHFTRA